MSAAVVPGAKFLPTTTNGPEAPLMDRLFPDARPCLTDRTFAWPFPARMAFQTCSEFTRSFLPVFPRCLPVFVAGAGLFLLGFTVADAERWTLIDYQSLFLHFGGVYSGGLGLRLPWLLRSCLLSFQASRSVCCSVLCWRQSQSQIPTRARFFVGSFRVVGLRGSRVSSSGSSRDLAERVRGACG